MVEKSWGFLKNTSTLGQELSEWNDGLAKFSTLTEASPNFFTSLLKESVGSPIPKSLKGVRSSKSSSFSISTRPFSKTNSALGGVTVPLSLELSVLSLGGLQPTKAVNKSVSDRITINHFFVLLFINFLLKIIFLLSAHLQKEFSFLVGV